MFGSVPGSASLQVLQPQPSFEELQHVAAQVQQLLLAGHRLEALRQAHKALLSSLYLGLRGQPSTAKCFTGKVE